MLPRYSRFFSLGLALIAALAAITACTSLQPSAKRFVVTEHGAVGDGQTVNTKALQALIDRCAAEGGGVIVVPRGVFLSGALYFKQGVNLQVEKDAVLKSTTAIADFPPIYTRWEGIERYWTSAFLNFVGLKNVVVSGEGVIDGSGDEWVKQSPRRGFTPGAPRPTPPPAPPPGSLPKPEAVYPSPLPTTDRISLAADPSKLPPINAAGIPLPRSGGGTSTVTTPPRALVFQNCSNVRVSGLALKNQARWGYVFIYCDHVVAEKLTARAEHNIPSSDSMDIDSCRQVLVAGCDFDCNDDCLSIKSGKDEDGRRVNRPCEDIVIEKTRFGYGHGGAAMGSETSGGIRNVEVRDCIAEAGNWAPIRFKSQPTRGGVVENITYRNIELRDVREAVVFDLEWNMRIATADAALQPPTVRNVKLINVHGTATAVGSIRGLANSFIDGVTFERCAITAQRPLAVEHARNVDTSGLTVTIADGPPPVRRP
jgi:polygalacturonase